MKAWLAALALIAALIAAVVLPLRASRARPGADMVATLAALVREEGTWDNQWDKPQEKIAELRAGLARLTEPQQRFTVEREIARHLLYDADADASIAGFEQILARHGPLLPGPLLEEVKAELAFAHFRKGETENCAMQHNADSCLLPIRGGGVHQHPRGSSEAVRLYQELLSDPATNPDNALAYRWLLNIGSMTLGQYPQGVPPQWLIPPEAFASDAEVGRFTDVAGERGLREFGLAGGVILEDFDGDGHLDLMVSHMGIADQLHYFHNDGDGHFTRQTDAAGLTGIVGGLNLIQADFDNDGCIDVLVLRGAWLHDHGRFPPSLLRNNCDGTFTDVTARAGLWGDLPTQAAAFADVDGDGWLDLFIGHEIDRSRVGWSPTARNFELYLNNRDGTFTEVGAASGIRLEGMVKAAVFGDYDNDGRPDLYVSLLGRPNHLFKNLGGPPGTASFADVTAQAGVAEPLMSFTCWFFDYDNDGWPDLFVSGYQATLPEIAREYLGDAAHAQGERPRLYHNNRDGTFTDLSRAAHLDKLLLTMGANFGDLDNDGFLDFYLGTGAPPLSLLRPNRMFRNDGGRTFQDVTTSGGFGHLQKGHAVAFGDVDGSGNQDVVEVMGGVYPSDRFWMTLYKNPGHGNHWVKLRLQGVKANRFAVGARLRLVSAMPDGSRRTTYATVGSGGSFGASSLSPHLGVGQATRIETLEIRWPGSGTVQELHDLAVDHTYAVREGAAAASLVE